MREKHAPRVPIRRRGNYFDMVKYLCVRALSVVQLLRLRVIQTRLEISVVRQLPFRVVQIGLEFSMVRQLRLTLVLTRPELSMVGQLRLTPSGSHRFSVSFECIIRDH